MDQTIVDFLDRCPTPGQGTPIVSIPPDVYLLLYNSMANSSTVMMEGIDVYAYSAMITYVSTMYTDFPSSCFQYVYDLKSHYNDTLTSINQAVMISMIRSGDRRWDKFREIVMWNWINADNLFRNTLFPTIEASNVEGELDLNYIEETFRIRYPY